MAYTNSNVIKQDYGREFSIGLYVESYGYFWLDNTDIYKFYFIEDLYSYTLTGKLQFHDRNNIFEFGSLIGGISVNVVFGEEYDVGLFFHVYRADRTIPSGPNEEGKHNVIELTLGSENFHYLNHQRFSRSWSNENLTEIVSDIIKNMVNVESTQYDITDNADEKISFVMPYWTPNQALTWLLLRASSNEKWGYCCYTMVTPGARSSTLMKVETIESMLRQSTILNDVNDGIYLLSTDKPYYYNRILSYDISGLDLFSNKKLRGGHVLGYDFNRKKLLDEKFQYSQGQNTFNENIGESIADKFTMFGDWTLMAGTEYSNLNDIDTNLVMMNDDDEIIMKNIYLNNWIKGYCLQNMMSITVRGHESRQIGKLIQIQWPSSSRDEVYNTNLSGLYLIKNITHYFSPRGKPSYRQKLGLIRNAYNYEEMSNRVLYPAQKKNTNVGSLLGVD